MNGDFTSEIYVQLRGQGWFHDLAVRQAQLITELQELVASQQAVEPSPLARVERP